MNNRISNFFFAIFVLLLPWQTRIIFTPDPPVGGTEFLTFSIYFSEIFLWLALARWLTSADLKKILVPNVFLFFCLFVFLSLLWSLDKIAAFRLWLFIFDGIMVYLFLREHNEMRRTAVKILLFSIFIAAVFGIWQFFNLGSPAEKWLGLAERGAWNLGDIVIEAGGGRWLRAYGPFPHPNIFGGYLAAGILLIFYLKMYYPNTSRPRSIWMEHSLYFLGGIFLFALFLTFSRSAWIALAINILFLPLVIKGEAWIALAINILFLPLVIKGEVRWGIIKFILFLSALAICLSVIFWPFVKTRVTSAGRTEIKSNTERVASWRDGFAVWMENPVFGTGIGNYTIGFPKPYSQPAHNIFLMVLAELGILGFFIYLFVWKKFWKNLVARPFLILFFIIGMLDHYLWTLYSGQMLFWAGLGLTMSNE